MHDGGAPEWRQVVEQSHARLMEEVARAIGAECQQAVENAVATERESAKSELEKVRESAKSELEKVRESAKAQMAALRVGAETELDQTRAALATELERVRGQGNVELEKVRQQAAAQLDKSRLELDEAVTKSRSAARQSTAEALNQSLRRIRQTSSPESALDLLAELSAGYAQKSVVLVFENGQARVAAARGVTAELPGPSNGSPHSVDLTLENAPALASAIESRDPITVLARDAEVSSPIVRLLDAGPAEKLYLFPITSRHHVVAMLVVSGEVFAPAAELLAEAVGMRLETVTAAAKEAPAENLVRIQQAGVPAGATSDRRSWGDLSPEDQKLHLQAQRVARVRVAKMRLDREDAWRRGLAQSDVYGALRRDIESARTEFLQTFLSKSSTMVDYLHLEILRSLANDDDRVLGREYPGPMV